MYKVFKFAVMLAFFSCIIAQAMGGGIPDFDMNAPEPIDVAGQVRVGQLSHKLTMPLGYYCLGAHFDAEEQCGCLEEEMRSVAEQGRRQEVERVLGEQLLKILLASVEQGVDVEPEDSGAIAGPGDVEKGGRWVAQWNEWLRSENFRRQFGPSFSQR